MSNARGADKLSDLFPGGIPQEAYDLVWNGPAEMTVAEVRQKLRDMAAEIAARPASPDPDREG